jgi:PKD repeat protein
MADFSCPARAGVGDSVRFTNRSVALDGSVEHVLWDFGEGVPDTTFEGVHAYRRAGTFRVTLVVWDTHGRGAVRQRAIVIGPADLRR